MAMLMMAVVAMATIVVAIVCMSTMAWTRAKVECGCGGAGGLKGSNFRRPRRGLSPAEILRGHVDGAGWRGQGELVSWHDGTRKLLAVLIASTLCNQQCLAATTLPE